MPIGVYGEGGIPS